MLASRMFDLEIGVGRGSTPQRRPKREVTHPDRCPSLVVTGILNISTFYHRESTLCCNRPDDILGRVVYVATQIDAVCEQPHIINFCRRNEKTVIANHGLKERPVSQLRLLFPVARRIS